MLLPKVDLKRKREKKKKHTHENGDCPAYGLQAVSIT